ncbi:hypothetical protein JZ751_013370 [Albula glossodonta]|uniref:V-type proton ATPase subunit a n=1 Tax=Albula glossodonta TaxID=121402 RepID=A0A8T2MLT7_9TELE|nr:hypothetical protein JZ751_013370 [Albula glossodonta]
MYYLSLSQTPQPRELLAIEEESERLARELREVSRNRESLRNQLAQLCRYRGVLICTHSLTTSQATPPFLKSSSLLDNRQDVRLSFVAGVVHPWKVLAFERLLWRACRGYIIINFREMEEKLEEPDTVRDEGREGKREGKREGGRGSIGVGRNVGWQQHACVQVGWQQHVCVQVGWQQHVCVQVGWQQHACVQVGWQQHACVQVGWQQHACVQVGWQQHACVQVGWQQHACVQVGWQQHACVQGEMVQWTVFLISYWGEQIGQKVKKICDW